VPVSHGDPGEVIRVGMLANWCDSRELCELFNRMTSAGNYEWEFRDAEGAPRRLRMVTDAESADCWAVLNAPRPEDRGSFDPARTVVFQMEPLMSAEGMRERWGEWAAPSPLSYLQVRDHGRYRNSNDWWVGRSYSELRDGPALEKSRTMAACVSAKYFDPGHIRRIDFLRFLDGQDLDLDIYGDPANGFRRFRGPTPPHDKSAAVLPYRYYFDAENNSAPNFFTEKIVDCLLGEALCFYWGCPNLDSFFDPRAFIRLELEDFEADLARIREAIAADEWSARLPYIRAEKRRILEDFQFFPTLARAIDPARRRRRWSVGDADAGLVDRWIGARRAGTFVEISDRGGGPETSETLDVERRLDWSGLCLEADAERVGAGRRIRDCTVARDDGSEAIEGLLARNAVSPIAIDWLNLAVEAPSELLREGGRLDPGRVRANLISMPRADAAERARCFERLASFGYEADPDSGAGEAIAARRSGREQIFGFYHLYTANNWRSVLGEQLERVEDSGLAGATTRVFASVVGPEAGEASALLSAALGAKVEVIHAGADASAFERPILERMRHFCEHDEPLARGVWYLHAKGVSDQHFENPNVADWRRFMERHIVDDWRECAGALEDHDACGVNWHPEPAPHFSGNFWWATPRYITRLPERIGSGHFAPEGWIGSSQPRVRRLAESGVNHYHEPFPASAYPGAERRAGRLRGDPRAQVPPIYCVRLESNSARGERMRRRLAHHGLLERTTFVPAIAIPQPDEWSLEWKIRAMRACAASHVEAMRRALDDPVARRDGVIICEDDILIHNEFSERVAATLANLPEGATLCQFGYALHHDLGELVWAGRDPAQENLCRLVPDMVWAAHMYWVSPDYARHLLAEFGDRSVDDFSQIIEHQITHPSDGYVSFPSLALQDLIDSTIRPEEEMDDHYVGQAGWPYMDYSECEEGEHDSPLARPEAISGPISEALAATTPAQPGYAS
jgi:GR25 family glycosyltransferase involved in LPS biosynthesis